MIKFCDFPSKWLTNFPIFFPVTINECTLFSAIKWWISQCFLTIDWGILHFYARDQLINFVILWKWLTQRFLDFFLNDWMTIFSKKKFLQPMDEFRDILFFPTGSRHRFFSRCVNSPPPSQLPNILDSNTSWISSEFLLLWYFDIRMSYLVLAFLLEIVKSR